VGITKSCLKRRVYKRFQELKTAIHVDSAEVEVEYCLDILPVAPVETCGLLGAIEL